MMTICVDDINNLLNSFNITFGGSLNDLLGNTLALSAVR
jgi:hypothetical protein